MMQLCTDVRRRSLRPRPHSSAGTTAPDAMRVERAGTFAQAFRGGLR